VPAFFFILMAGIQLMVISWNLSQVQLATTKMARTLGLPPSQTGGDSCAKVRTDAPDEGRRIFGGSVIGAPQVDINPPTCPPPAGSTVVLTVSYTATIFMGTLIPGQQTFTYRGVAVAVVERDPVELS